MPEFHCSVDVTRHRASSEHYRSADTAYYRIFSVSGTLLGVIPLKHAMVPGPGELMLLQASPGELTALSPLDLEGDRGCIEPGSVVLRIDDRPPTLVSPLGGERRLYLVAGVLESLAPFLRPSTSQSEELTLDHDGNPV